MSDDMKLIWACKDGVYYLVGWPYRHYGPMVRKRDQGWAWVIAQHNESQYAETLEGAQLAALEASLVAVRPFAEAAEAELRRLKGENVEVTK